MLMKRASELRDILGLSKCSTSLSTTLNKPPTDSKIDYPTDKPTTPVTMKRTPSNLRAEATEWTPPSGTESSSNILKKVLQLGLKSEPPPPPNTLLPPFVGYPSVGPAPGAYYIPAAKVEMTDLTGDGKDFISSLSAKRDINPPPLVQKPIAPPNKRPIPPPPGLTPTSTQQVHTFPLNVSLLPQTFSVHLLSTLHMRFQHVSV